MNHFKPVQFVNLRGEPVDVRAMESEYRKQRHAGLAPPRRKPTVKNGYAAVPGTGPEGKTCRDCAHKHRMGNYGSKSYIKCELRRDTWTHGEGTDILARSPACSKFVQAAAKVPA